MPKNKIHRYMDKGYMVFGTQDYTFKLPVFLVETVKEVGDIQKIITNLLYYYCETLEAK